MANASSAPVKQGSRPSATSDLTALKIRQQAAWSSGNYAVVGATLQIVGEQLCETLNLKPGSKVLDVAAGNGMASLAAARRWADVTSTDYVPALLQNGRAREKPKAIRSSLSKRMRKLFRSMTAISIPCFPLSA
jgi:protein-L-isoaspartate O-methyltransferase